MGTQVIYFTAPWCVPCRTFGPLIERVTTELDIRLVKLNVEEHADTAEEFAVLGLPTIVVMRDGHESDRLSGAVSEATLRKVLS